MRNSESGSRPKKEEQENSALSRYWKQYNFRGMPPKSGTIAEKRLEDKCREYTHMVLNAQLRGAIGQDRRRELHNEIAVMVLGNSREQMDYQTAEKISDFASILTTGMTLENALAEYEKYKE